MSQEMHERVTMQFLKAVSLNQVDRLGFLEDLRLRDPGLCAEVESLLRHDGRDDVDIVRPGEPLRALSRTLHPAERVGPYFILSKLGEGGMGVVYRAERREPVRYEVAVKLIRPGLESGRVLARFEEERRVLALMDHPGIAKVFDSGFSGDGRPFVALEYVRGEPITVFCDRGRLDVAERLILLCRVCEAVHHAHQNAIIHRDLKPSNVLVVEEDGRPVPKIIDFGIAKALSREASPGAGNTLTIAGEFVGTPAYMSPEQAALPHRPVDVRTDVYSLGALLYELLTGTPPFDPARLPETRLGEVRRVLVEDDPEPPSRRVAEDRPGIPGAAENRRSDPRGLARTLRGDLDAIVAKSIAKEPERRYGSARELAEDIQRTLRHEPIEARPPTAAYRLRKLVRRHRTAAAVIATVVPLTFGFAMAMAVQAHRVALERDRAEEISEFVVGLYGTPYSQSARHGAPDPSRVLLRAAERVENGLTDRPLLQARLLNAIGETLRGVGDLPHAVPILEDGVSRLMRIGGPEHPSTLKAQSDLAHAYADEQRFSESEALYRRSLEAQRRTIGTEALDTLRTMRDLGFLLKLTRKLDESATLLEEAQAGLRRVLGETNDESLVATGIAASVELDRGRLERAKELLSWAIPRMPQEPGEKSMAVYNLACIHALEGNRPEALRLLEESAKLGFITRYVFDPNLESLHGTPEMHALERKARDLDPEYQERLIAQAGRTAPHLEGRIVGIYRHLIDTMPASRQHRIDEVHGFLGTYLITRGRYEEARPHIEAALAEWRSRQPPKPIEVTNCLSMLACIDIAIGNSAAARRELDEAIRLAEGPGGNQGKVMPHYYLRAVREAAFGDAATAVRYFENAIDQIVDPNFVHRETAFRRLRGMPRFERALATLEKRAELTF